MVRSGPDPFSEFLKEKSEKILEDYSSAAEVQF